MSISDDLLTEMIEYASQMDLLKLLEGYGVQLSSSDDQGCERDEEDLHETIAQKSGRKGGIVRASRLSAERRKEIASLAAKSRWKIAKQ